MSKPVPKAQGKGGEAPNAKLSPRWRKLSTSSESLRDVLAPENPSRIIFAWMSSPPTLRYRSCSPRCVSSASGLGSP